MAESEALKKSPDESVIPLPRNDVDDLDADTSVYLMGLPKLRHFLRFIRHHATAPEDEDELMRQWQGAKEYFASLAHSEPGAADDPSIVSLGVGGEYEPLLRKLFADPLIKNSFNTVPTEVALVELDKMVVYQKHIDVTFAEQLRQRLGTCPSNEEVFHTCLPYDHPSPPSKWSRIDDETWIFVSRSNDIRFLGAMPLEANHVQGVPHPGALLGVIGLAVGFGTNFLNAIHAGNRLILHNGSHRAYALRALGLKHVPCIVQHVSTPDELSRVAPRDVSSDVDFFLKNPRPPMLKDYFDHSMAKTVHVQRVLRQVKVRFSVSEYYTPVV